MKLLKPTWISHDALPIFSVDIHPDGSRFATGGQAKDSGRIVIWNMAPIANEVVELDENVPKMLCQLDNHLACVNSVRWSNSGKYLASGGDDKLIMIWMISRYPSGTATVFGGGGKVNVESWRCSSTLRGHNGDVLDMAWSPHDAWLASCSVDNTVIIWNALKMPEMTAVLKGHSGLVKGVTWDPVGKFIASQSDDKTLRVWRTSDWKEESVIHEPFEECGGTTHVLRLSWSPDGQYLVSAHAMNGGGPTAQIVERDGWRQDKDFVGHRKAVTCVRFNSNILQKYYKSSSKPQQYCCCAIGSRDRSLSVWLTALKRPLVVVHELFSSSVLDLSWSVTGLQLMACSWDGTVAVIEFTEEELGKPLSVEEKHQLHERMYGKSLSSTMNMQACIMESPELLDVQGKAEKITPPKQVEVEKPSSVSQNSPMKGPINKQIETRTADGKRRITPMYIPPTPDTGDSPLPFGSSSMEQLASSSCGSKSRILVEKRDDVVQPNVTTVNTPEIQSNNQLEKVATSQAVTEKKVVAAPLITTEMKQDNQKAEKGSVSYKRKLDKDVSSNKYISIKRIRQPVVPAEKPTPSLPPPMATVSVTEQPGIMLPQLKCETMASVQLCGGRQRIEVQNEALLSAHGSLTCVRMFYMLPGIGNEDAQAEWEAVLGSTACGMVANLQVVVVVCADATLHVFHTKTGQMPIPPIVLSAPASRLAINAQQHVMVLTCRGNVSVWDLAKKKVLIKDESLVPIMKTEKGSVVTVLSCSLTEQGFPLLSLSTGKAFTFSPDFGSWILLGDSRDPVQKSCAHKTLMHTVQQKGNMSLPLASAQAHIISPVSSIANRLGQSSAAGPLCTISFLERQLSSCQTLNSKEEFRTWLLCLARFLIQEGLEPRLRLLCSDLLGPAHGHAQMSRSWENSIMGFSKHSLLKEILDLMASNLRLQRIYIEYNEQLNKVDAKMHNGFK